MPRTKDTKDIWSSNHLDLVTAMTEVSSSGDCVGGNKGERGTPGGAGLERTRKSLLLHRLSCGLCVFLEAKFLQRIAHTHCLYFINVHTLSFELFNFFFIFIRDHLLPKSVSLISVLILLTSPGRQDLLSV